MSKHLFNILFQKLKDLEHYTHHVQQTIINQIILEVLEPQDLAMAISLILQKYNHILKITMIQLVHSL